VRKAAAAAGVTPRTARKWLARFRQEGEAGLADRPSRPWRTRRRAEGAAARQAERLRRARMPMRPIAAHTGLSAATVSRLLARIGLSSLKSLDPPAPPPVRYEHKAPGELLHLDIMLHLDIKKLGRFHVPGRRVGGPRSRGAGSERAHVAIDDYSRVGFVLVYPDEREGTAVAFLRQAVRRILTDNGRPTAPASSRRHAGNPASATALPARTAPRPTARPNASSRPTCASGPTAASGRAARNAMPTCTTSWRTTTHAAPIPPSTDCPRSPALGGTTYCKTTLRVRTY
jgi:hypothetical protein